MVTGAGGGMGLQIARDLLEAGATVAGIDVKDRPRRSTARCSIRATSATTVRRRAIGAAFAETGRPTTWSMQRACCGSGATARCSTSISRSGTG